MSAFDTILRKLKMKKTRQQAALDETCKEIAELEKVIAEQLQKK